MNTNNPTLQQLNQDLTKLKALHSQLTTALAKVNEETDLLEIELKNLEKLENLKTPENTTGFKGLAAQILRATHPNNYK
mgnify:CR=1 FL=1|tara:strand:+ start:128 stop:364 length:237 start_codon:yes stop_codon:yes gene_type:complete